MASNSPFSDLTVDRISAHLRGNNSDAKVLETIHPLQIQHRIAIARHFFDSASGGVDLELRRAGGRRVLEVGCGQGDMTIVLAELLGPEGRVTAIDPAPLDYGAPLTLGQAQAILTTSAIGSRLTFRQADVPSFYGSATPAHQEAHDIALLVHCLFYFPSEADLLTTLTTLRTRGQVKHLCLAEWSLSTSHPTAIPHLLAILAQAYLPEADANIRTIFSPEQLRALAQKAGWKLRTESVLPNPDVQDGRWEVGMTLHLQQERNGSGAAGSESTGGGDEQARAPATFSAMCDSIRAHLPDPSGSAKGVTCVDVWTAVFDAA